MEGDLSILYFGLMNNGIFNATYRFSNNGSVPYKVRGRLDIYNETGYLIFTGWSQEFEFYPSKTKIFETYWFPINDTGNFTAEIKIYYGNEIYSSDKIEFSIKETHQLESLKLGTKVKVYDGEIDLNFNSDIDLENFILIPYKYPKGWIFEQTRLKGKRASIGYSPTVWVEGKTLTFLLISEDGKYGNFQEVQIKKEHGIIRFLHNLKSISRFIMSENN